MMKRCLVMFKEYDGGGKVMRFGYKVGDEGNRLLVGVLGVGLG